MKKGSSRAALRVAKGVKDVTVAGLKGIGKFFAGGTPGQIAKSMRPSRLARGVRNAPTAYRQAWRDSGALGKAGLVAGAGLTGAATAATAASKKKKGDGRFENLGRKAGDIGEMGMFMIPGALPAATALTTGGMLASAATGKDISLGSAGAIAGKALDKIFGASKSFANKKVDALRNSMGNIKKNRPKGKPRQGQQHEMRSDY